MPLAINLEAFETTIQPAEEPNAFHRLVRDLSRILGPSSGLDSAEVVVTDIENLMQKYSSNASEWKQYAFGDLNQTFTRNLVDRGNGKSNLLILVWTSRKESPIHDHANSHCVMKILQGSLKETLYEWPDQDALDKGKKSPLRIKKETIYSENQVTYMCDELGLHKIENPDPAGFAVSLHLYTPPNAAKFGCSMFDRDTGASSHMKSSQYFSEMGQLTPKK